MAWDTGITLLKNTHLTQARLSAGKLHEVMTNENTRLRASLGTRSDTVVLITHADCDAAHERARQLLGDGHRVAVTSPHLSRLSRILLAQPAGQMYAIAADITDPLQLTRAGSH